MIKIRAARQGDEQAWKSLWAEYNAFYGAVVPARVTNRTWARLLDKRSSLLCRLAEENGIVLGFANVVIHDGTWAIRPIAYLEDLYVAPAARRRGVATALIEDVIRLARTRAWDRLYWHTRADNAAARRVYDRFALADGFVRYRLPLR